MAIFKCKICGGSLEIGKDQSVITCEYCDTKQTLPRLDNERRSNLYDRANHFRRNNEFDKAMGIYESILNEDATDAEAYWSIVLCRYGVEYVNDPKSKGRVPTVNRAQFTSIFDDENYKSAIAYADVCQRELYRAEANIINEIQKNILSISQNEDPFDVFICYKETDSLGKRSRDSVLAQELYYELCEEGFKVFFSRITLEGKLGVAYEPYIFAALNSAKVMVVLGTSPENFNAVWVKNEWSRFLGLARNDADKVLIPAYKDMDPYDLPEEFSHLQAQDMSKLGFMQDLTHGIKKILGADDDFYGDGAPFVSGVNARSLLERAFIFIEDGDFVSGDEYLEKVLNLEPRCAEAYLGKLMIDLKVKRREGLAGVKTSFAENVNYKRIKRFGSDELVGEIDEILENVVKQAQIRATRLDMLADRELEKREREFELQENAEDAEKNDDLFENIFHKEGKFNLTVKRENQFNLLQRDVKMKIGDDVYYIKNDSTMTIQVDKGPHTIDFSILFRKTKVKINVTGDTEINLKIDMFTGQIQANVEQFTGMSMLF